jgi:hypothetical protein
MTSPAGRRFADLEIPRPQWVAALMAGGAIAVLLYLGRHLSFLYDEWTFAFIRRDGGAYGLFAPHNEHWSTLLVLIYRGLFMLVGLRNYVPYLAVLELLHAGCALLLFAIIRRRSGTVIGLAAMLLFLFLGRGAENMLWAFQIGFVGSAACGLAAIWLLDRPAAGLGRVGLGSLALVASLMFQGVGLFFCAALFVDLVFDRERRPYLLSLVLPAAAYLAWFAAFGRFGVASHRSPLSLAAVLSLASYVPFGVGAAIAGLAGLSSRWSAFSLAAAATLVGIRWSQRGRIDSRVLGAIAGLLSQFALTGLVRAQFGDQQAAAPRYVYIAAIFLLLVLTDLLPELRWRGMLAWALVAGFALAVLNGGVHLIQFANQRVASVRTQTAELETLSVFRGAPDMDRRALVDPLLPPITAGEYFVAVDALGSPVPATDLNGLTRLPGAAVNQAMESVFAGALRVGGSPAPVDGSCQQFPATSTVYVDRAVPSGGTVTLSGSAGGTASLWISYLADPVGPPEQQVVLIPGSFTTVRLPDTGKPIEWNLRVALPAAGTLSICAG